MRNNLNGKGPGALKAVAQTKLYLKSQQDTSWELHRPRPMSAAQALQGQWQCQPPPAVSAGIRSTGHPGTGPAQRREGAGKQDPHVNHALGDGQR